MIVGTAILASSTTLAQLLVGRVVTGIVKSTSFWQKSITQKEDTKLGILSRETVSTVRIFPLIRAELCDPAKWGMLLSLRGTVTIVGLCIAYWLDFGFMYVVWKHSPHQSKVRLLTSKPFPISQLCWWPYSVALPRCVPSVLRHLLGSSDAAASRETSLSRPQ